MKRIFLFTLFTFVAAVANATTFSCTNASQIGIGFDDVAKHAWKIAPDNFRKIEININPDGFNSYKCQGCYSFEGVLLAEGQIINSTARTYYNTDQNQMLMNYGQSGSDDQTIEELLLCSVVGE